MSIATVYSRAQTGMDAPLVSVEVHLSNGLPCFSIVGLPETSVRESKERVRAAIINSNFEFPARRITVNLAPAELPKEGSRFDLAIAIGILAASNQIPTELLGHYEFIGELALSAELRPVEAVLPSALGCAASGKQLIVGQGNADDKRARTDADDELPPKKKAKLEREKAMKSLKDKEGEFWSNYKESVEHARKTGSM